MPKNMELFLCFIGLIINAFVLKCSDCYKI